METINKKNNKIVFSAEIDESLANSIRRYVSQIPVIAIDEVEISVNDSPLYDETIAHRIGLIPIKTDKKPSKKEFKIELKSKKEGYVYSGEITGDVKVVYEKIPITLLNKDTSLELTGTARFGKGVNHSKFSPGLMFYRNSSEIVLDKNLKEKMQQLCPQCKIQEKGDKIIVLDNQEKEFGDLLEGLAYKEGKKYEIKENPELIITIESFGQLSVEDVFKNSIESLKSDLAEVSKKLK